MNAGKTLFAQVMEFVPWTSFARIVTRYSGGARVSTLRSAEHFRIMAYAQLTWRESLRDIEGLGKKNQLSQCRQITDLFKCALHRGGRLEDARTGHDGGELVQTRPWNRPPRHAAAKRLDQPRAAAWKGESVRCA